MPVSEPLDPEHLAGQFRALADRTRLRILDLLRCGERCVCELAEAVGATQPLLSHHLRTLKEAGLVSDRRDGRWIHYSARTEELEALGSQLSHLCTPLPEQGCCTTGNRESRTGHAFTSSSGAGNEGPS